MAQETEDRLREMAKSYDEDLEAVVVAGTMYRIDGNNVVIDDIDEWKQKEWEKQKAKFLSEHPFTDPDDLESYENEEEYVTDNIGEADDIDEPDEQVSLDEYLNDQSLGDVRFEVSSDMELHGGKILLACGGPTFWLHDDEICGYWGSDEYSRSLSGDVKSALWSWFEEQWGMARDSRG